MRRGPGTKAHRVLLAWRRGDDLVRGLLVLCDHLDLGRVELLVGHGLRADLPLSLRLLHGLRAHRAEAEWERDRWLRAEGTRDGARWEADGSRLGEERGSEASAGDSALEPAALG